MLPLPQALQRLQPVVHEEWSSDEEDDDDEIEESRWNIKAIADTVQLWGLTTIQRASLLELGKHLEDIDHPKNCPADVVRFYMNALESARPKRPAI